MFAVDEENGRLVKTGEPTTGFWVPERPLQVFNSWLGKWEPVHQVAHYGKEFRIGSITTFSLKYLKVRYEANTESTD